MLYFILFILGLIVGSFLSMLTYRLPRDLSLLGRSFCDSCKKQISWAENIPLLSFLNQGGKCKKCQNKISTRYPIIELLTGILFALTGYFLQGSQSSIVQGVEQSLGVFALPFFLLVLCCFIALTLVDLELNILPDEIVLVLGIGVFILLLLSPSPILFTGIFWGFVVFAFFLLLYLVTRGRGMGFGDVKMSFVLGALLGFPGILTWLFLSFFMGALSGIILLVLGKARFGQPIPFGPYLLVAAWLTIFLGNVISSWYLKYLQ